MQAGCWPSSMLHGEQTPGGGVVHCPSEFGNYRDLTGDRLAGPRLTDPSPSTVSSLGWD